MANPAPPPSSNERTVTLPEFIELLSEPVYIQPWMRQYIMDALSDLQSRRVRETGCSGWRPIETAPKNELALFWVVDKTAEETYLNTCGHPILGNSEPRIAMTHYHGWSSLSKATHWMPLPASPVKTTPKPESWLLTELAQLRENLRDTIGNDYARIVESIEARLMNDITKV